MRGYGFGGIGRTMSHQTCHPRLTPPNQTRIHDIADAGREQYPAAGRELNMTARVVVLVLILFVTGMVALAADSASQPTNRPAAGDN